MSPDRLPRELRNAAQNEALHREANEAIEGLAHAFGEQPDLLLRLCECGDSHCTRRLRVGKAEYEQVRADPTTFFVAHGHEIPDIERIVHSTPEYLVVQKVGAAGEIVIRAAETAEATEAAEAGADPGEQQPGA